MNTNSNFDERPINSNYHQTLLAYGNSDKNFDFKMPS